MKMMSHQREKFNKEIDILRNKQVEILEVETQ